MFLVLNRGKGFLIRTGQCRRSFAAVTMSDNPSPNSLSFFRNSFPSLTPQQWAKLESLEEELRRWNSEVNLVSRKDIDNLVPHHIIPSLAVSLVKDFKGMEGIDVGSGGGFPGLPLAIASPEASFTLLDSNGKKMAVVEAIAKKLKLENVRVIRSRAEDFKESFDFMLGRAVSALPNFLSFSSHFLDEKSAANKECGLYYIKGGDFSQELLEAKIQNSAVKIHPINRLIPNLETDKNVLYLPASEILLFHGRKNAEAHALEKTKKKKKVPSESRAAKMNEHSNEEDDYVPVLKAKFLTKPSAETTAVTMNTMTPKKATAKPTPKAFTSNTSSGHVQADKLALSRVARNVSKRLDTSEGRLDDKDLKRIEAFKALKK